MEELLINISKLSYTLENSKVNKNGTRYSNVESLLLLIYSLAKLNDKNITANIRGFKTLNKAFSELDGDIDENTYNKGCEFLESILLHYYGYFYEHTKDSAFLC